MSARARARIKSQPGFIESVTIEKQPIVANIHMFVIFLWFWSAAPRIARPGVRLKTTRADNTSIAEPLLSREKTFVIS